MLLPDQIIQIKNRYGNVVKEVRAEDLTKHSKQIVKVKCDYCGEILEIPCYRYTNAIEKFGDYACKKCRWKRKSTVEKANASRVSTFNTKYGVDNCSQIEEVKIIKEKKSLEKYGVKNIAQSEEIKDKIKVTNLERYGTTSSVHGGAALEKCKQTCLERYGKETYFGSDIGKETVIKYNQENYGVDYALQSPEFRKDRLPIGYPSTDEKLGIEWISSIYDEVETQKSIGRYRLDAVIKYNNQFINVEFDGEYWHTKDEQTIQKDIERDQYLLNQNYKVLRIIYSKTLRQPQKEKVLNTIIDFVNSKEKYLKVKIN